MANSYWSNSAPKISLILFDSNKNELPNKITLDSTTKIWSISHPEADPSIAFDNKSFWVLAYINMCSFRNELNTDFTTEVFLDKNMLKATWIPFTMTLTKCGVLTPIQNPVQINVQKNKGIASQVLIADVTKMFAAPSDFRCEIKDYELQTFEGTLLAPENPLYARLVQSQKAILGLKLNILTMSSSVVNEVFVFKVRAIQKQNQGLDRVQNPNLVNMNVTLGCFEETYLRVRKATTLVSQYFKSFEANVLKLIMPVAP